MLDHQWESSMVDTEKLFNNIRPPPNGCLMTFLSTIIYSHGLSKPGITSIQYFGTKLDLVTDLDLYTNYRGLRVIFATVVEWRQRALTPPDTWFRPIWGLHVFLLRPAFPEVDIFQIVPRFFFILKLSEQNYKIIWTYIYTFSKLQVERIKL